eukprot:scaffold630_cov174-Amphora_coffeaeformis.AAC.24
MDSILEDLQSQRSDAPAVNSPSSSSSIASDLLPHLTNCDKPPSTRTLQEMAKDYQPSKFWRYAHTSFDRFYPNYLEKYRAKKFRMLEIGLDTGQGSLLWAEYFPCATLIGLEYNPDNTQNQGASKLQTVLGDQGNHTFLMTDFMEQTNGGNFDVIIDDGGHHYEQQRTSYEVLFEHALNPGGLYIMEDVETSYWKKGFNLYDKPVTRGGQSEPNTIVNQFKSVVDVVNKKFYDNSYKVFGMVDQLVATVSFGSNLIVLEKKDHRHCFSERPYIWRKRLADDCPAKRQKGNTMKGSPMHKLCGDSILKTDKENSRQE